MTLSANGSGESFRDQAKRLIEIAISLSAELRLDVLLERILVHARDLTLADAGTLYLLKDGQLHFEILQNATLGIALGGATGKPILLDPVHLVRSNVCAYAAILGQTVSIEDVYSSRKFDFSGPRIYDRKTGYRSTSMLVVPMKNHEGNVIGVLQLLNAIDPGSRAVIPFRPDLTALVEALASLAAVAIENATLIRETKDLFHSLVKVLAAAIDAKSHHTGNHVQRVALLNTFLAQTVNRATEGPLREVTFSEKQMEEIYIAGWLHDIGKITTPVNVMNKSTKLETIVDRIVLIETRFRLIAERLVNDALRRKLARAAGSPGGEEAGPEDEELARSLGRIDAAIGLVRACNQPGEFMNQAAVDGLNEVARATFELDGRFEPYLTGDELENLCIRRGTLTEAERLVMQEHINWTIKLLTHIPCKGYLANVPLYAGQHHEKLNGKGYPAGATAADIPIQSRILAIADFYEALSAKDRPYKKPMTFEQITAILKESAARNEIDPDLLDLIIREGAFEAFEREFETLARDVISFR